MAALDIQCVAMENLKELLQKSDVVQLVGPDGSGRMYTANLLNGEHIVLIVNNASKDESLQSIKNALISYHNLLTIKNITANISASICHGLSLGASFNKSNPADEEMAIIKYLKKLSKRALRLGKSTPIIIAIRDIARSERIDKFLFLALKKINYKSSRLKVIYLTSTNTFLDNIPYVNIQLLNKSKMSYKQILQALNIRYDILNQLTSDEISFIFSICMNNLNDLITVVKELNENIISFENLFDNRNSLARIIGNCFNRLSLTNGNTILTYCSHAQAENKDLTEIELEYLIGVRQNGLKRELDGVQKLHILKSCDNYIKILVQLVSKIAMDKSANEQIEIYRRFNDMLSCMYPSNYAAKYKFALKIDSEAGAVVKTQHYLQQIRLRLFDYNIEDLPENYKEFVIHYFNAMNYCIKLDYSKALLELEEYMNARNLTIRAEASLLIAQALMKSLDGAKRTTALNILHTLDFENCDDNLKYRIIMCKISALVHKGKYLEAVTAYNKIVAELEDKISQYYSEELSYNLHVLLRKSNMVYNFQAARGGINVSKIFFKNKKAYFIDYFYALCNSLCSNIENMLEDKAKEDIDEFETLQLEHSDTVFKRQYIFENNKILCDYFFNNQTPSDTAIKLYNLFSKMSNYADRFLIANNYAVFKALSGDVCSAIKFLKQNAECNTSDDEGVYEYRSKVNTAIMEYILDNSCNTELVSKLQNICLDKDQPNRSFKENELNIICRVMQIGSCSSATEWVQQFKSFIPNNRPANIYEQGFIITPLSNWDDD